MTSKRGLIRYSICCGLIALSAGIASQPAMAQQRVYSIGEMSLSKALRQYIRVSGRQIVFTEDLVRGRRAGRLVGSYSADDALARILSGTGLKASKSSSGVLMIVPGQTAALAQPVEIAEPTETPAPPEPEPADIVVTAQKRTQNLHDVPSAVSVVSSELIDNLHATQLTDFAGYVPGLNVESGGTPGQTAITIRGIAAVGSGATVATYIDDSPVGSSSAYGGANDFAMDLLPYDIERVEVLRGPQGTLYGASSMGGLLKYVLNTPSLDEFHAKIGGDVFGVSDAGQAGFGVRATVSVPLIRDRLALSASYALEDNPGFIDNALTGERNQNDNRQQSARLALFWEPTEAISVRLNGLYQKVESDGNGVIALDAVSLQPIAGRKSNINRVAEPFDKEIKYVSGSLNWDLGGVELVSATSYSDSDSHHTSDATLTWGEALPLLGLPPGEGLSEYFYDIRIKKFTQEIRLASASDSRLEWLAGLFYTHERTFNAQAASARFSDGTLIPGANPLAFGNLPSTYKEYAGFGSLTFHLTDRFELSGGLRYSHNRQVFGQELGGLILSPVTLEGRSSEGVWTYSLGAKFDINDDVMVYGRVASGYKPGGPNLAIPGVPPTFDADTLTNYEIGLKSRFWRNRILFDVAAFHIDWDDIQVLSNTSISYALNGGTARSNGIEANLSFRPVRGLSLDGTFAYIDAALTQDIPELGGLDGDRLPNTPRYSGSIRAAYSHRLSDAWTADFGAGLRLQGRRFSSVTSSANANPLPGYAALDLNAGITNGRYTLRAFAKNVTNTNAYLTYSNVTGVASGVVKHIEATLLRPRTVGLSFDVQF